MDRERYRELFLSEAGDHLRAAEERLSALDGGHRGDRDPNALFRHMHSVKGMAATMGFTDMVAVAHALEDLLEPWRNDATAEVRDPAMIALLWEGLACLTRILHAVRRDDAGCDGQAVPLARRIRDAAGQDVTERPPAGPSSMTRTDDHPPSEDPDPPVPHWRLDAELPGIGAAGADRTVALIQRLGRIGTVVDIHPAVPSRERPGGARVGLVMESERPFDDIEHELRSIPDLDAFTLAPAPPRSADRPASPPAAPLVRVRADLLDRLMNQTTELVLAHESLSGALSRIGDPRARRVSERCRRRLKELHRTLVEVRTVPFAHVAHRMSRGVEELALRLGKRVRFEILGRDVRLDRSVLEALVDPLLHVVRNAIDHGVEDIETRIEAGKPGPGRITMELGRTHDRVRIAVRDDGRGLDPDAVRNLAVAGGFITRGKADTLDDEDALLLTTLPGFSTAAETTEISGRGIGMDVVRYGVEALGGRLRIGSSPGIGTEIRIELPQLAAVIQALLVRDDGQLFAVPLPAVERTLDVPAGTPRPGAGGTTLQDGSRSVHVVSLSECLGSDREVRTSPRAAIIPTGCPDRGLLVDEVVERREVLVRPLEMPLQAMTQYTGAALLDDGAVALVVDPGALRRSH